MQAYPSYTPTSLTPRQPMKQARKQRKEEQEEHDLGPNTCWKTLEIILLQAQQGDVGVVMESNRGNNPRTRERVSLKPEELVFRIRAFQRIAVDGVAVDDPSMYVDTDMFGGDYGAIARHVCDLYLSNATFVGSYIRQWSDRMEEKSEEAYKRLSFENRLPHPELVMEMHVPFEWMAGHFVESVFVGRQVLRADQLLENQGGVVAVELRTL